MKQLKEIPTSDVTLNLKDIYKSVVKGKRIRRIKEIKKKNKSVDVVKPIQLTEEQLNEDIITRWIDSFFEKVKQRRADEIIKDMKKKDPKLATSLEKIKNGFQDAMDELDKLVLLRSNDIEK